MNINSIPNYLELLPEEKTGKFQSAVELNYYKRARLTGSKLIKYDIHESLQSAYKQARIKAFKKDNIFCWADEINWVVIDLNKKRMDEIKKVNAEWIKEKFYNELKLERSDLMALLNLDKGSLSGIENGHRGLSKLGQAAFYYLYLNLKNKKR